MNIIDPKVEYWSEMNIAPDEHVARCASICYKSSNYNAEAMCNHLIKDGHLSMFRHRSHYYIVSKTSTAGNVIMNYMHYCKTFGVNPFIAVKIGSKHIYVSTNHQYVIEHEEFNNLMKMYEVSIKDFIKHPDYKSIIRYTFCITTSIKVSRELNRTSPNNIAEQSTRYVNFMSKDGDVSVCRSIDNHLTEMQKGLVYQYLQESCDNYTNLINNGLKPEDARRVLSLDTITRCAYTYTFEEWSNILDLRYFEKTGKAAPDCKLIASEIYDTFKLLGYYEQ